QDVARKGLILGRLLGYRGAPPAAEDLVPPHLRKVSVAAFAEALPSLDEEWRRRVERANAKGEVLRYVVRATPSSVRAALVAVPADSPVGALQGTRNLI